MPLTADKDLQIMIHKESEAYLEEAMRKSGGESTETQPRESPYESARETMGLDNHSL